MFMTFDDIYNLLATQKAIIDKQDEIISNKDIIISDLSRIKDIQEEQINRLKRRLNSVVNITPKTAHWKVASQGYGDTAYICECSNCKDTVWVYTDAGRKWKYCPNCGAKMTEPNENK